MIQPTIHRQRNSLHESQWSRNVLCCQRQDERDHRRCDQEDFLHTANFSLRSESAGALEGVGFSTHSEENGTRPTTSLALLQSESDVGLSAWMLFFPLLRSLCPPRRRPRYCSKA